MHTSIIDKVALRNLIELAGDEPQPFMEELFKMLFQNAIGQLATLKQGASACEWPLIVKAAHAIKGSAASVGASEIAYKAGQIEHLARTKAETHWAMHIEELENCFDRLQECLAGMGYL
jgi:HPt (histidine-containing phosphotransfer) domain-containing protein